MAVKKSASGKTMDKIEHKPKLTSIGCSKNTRYSATSRNKARKPYRGQGK
jgi:hypothetical protein